MDLLLIAASFFGYSEEIKRSLERRGRTVLWFEDRPQTTTAAKAAIRLAPSLVGRAVDEYFDRIIAQAQQHDIRDVLVIKGEALTTDIARRLRSRLPRAKFSLYFWDSYRNMPAESPRKVALFDKAYSFDPADVANDARLKYRPLFYIDEYAGLPKMVPDIDALFVGTVHSDRYKTLAKIGRALPAGFRYQRVMYMPSSTLFPFKKAFLPSYWRARRDEFIFTPLRKPELLHLIARTRIVVDIERVIQVGYTMRTIEMLGASKKIVSTNPRLAEADFFAPSNQLVIDRKNPIIPASFLESTWTPVSPRVLNRYSLDGWISEILG